MLINCPECNKEISDKAFACPNCGMPFKKTASAPIHRRASQNRYKKLPNGFGSIKHLSGNRRKPYACYPPTKGWVKENGKAKAIIPKAIGYFATYNEAYSALSEYNKTPYDTNMKTATFEDVYNMFMTEKFETGKEYALDTKRNYTSSFNLCKVLHKRIFVEIRKEDLQDVIDSIEKKYSTLKTVKNLFTQLYKYAISYNMGVFTNLGSLVVIKKNDDTEKGVPFTEDDIKILWNNAPKSIIVRITLIMIYSGLRIREVIEVSEIDLEKGAFIGGVKTSSGKGRIVPFHDSIVQFIPELIEYRKTHKSAGFRKQFYIELNELGILYCDGIKHTPHDCRHTFSWLADKYDMNEFSKHLIMGHSLGNDVEKAVYGHRTFEELKKAINQIVT